MAQRYRYWWRLGRTIWQHLSYKVHLAYLLDLQDIYRHVSFFTPIYNCKLGPQNSSLELQSYFFTSFNFEHFLNFHLMMIFGSKPLSCLYKAQIFSYFVPSYPFSVPKQETLFIHEGDSGTVLAIKLSYKLLANQELVLRVRSEWRH